MFAGHNAKLFRLLTFSLASGTALAGWGLPAIAQSQGGKPAVEEVIVTARKRDESVRDVPLALTVLSGQTLERRGIVSISQVPAATPGFAYLADYSGRANFTIRGAGGSLDPALPVGVGVFVDGVFQANPGFLQTPLFDVDRIEILKGPQSTLYGQNTLAGAISITTREPSEVPEAEVRAEYANGNSRSFAGTASGPIIGNTLTGRVVVGSLQRDGYFQYRNGKDSDTVDSTYGRASLIWKPTENFKAELRGDYLNSISLGFGYKEVRNINDTNGINGNPNIVDVDPNVERGTAKYYSSSLRLQYIVGNWKFVSLASLNKNKNDTGLDQDIQSLNLFTARRRTVLRDTSEEFRVEHEGDVINFIAGLYNSHSVLADESFTVIGSDYFLSFLNGFKIVNPRIYRTNDTVAGFADVIFKLNQKIELDVGARYANTSLEATLINTTRTFVSTQPRASIKYRISDDTNIYVNAANGYRSGGFNGANTIGTPYQTFNPDKLWSYELGVKTRQLDGRLGIDASVFYIDYSNYNSTNFVPLPSGPALLTSALARNAKSYGFDLDAGYKFSEELRLKSTFGYNKTELNNLVRLVPTAPLLATEGGFIPTVPEWTFSFGGEYVTPISGTGLDMTLYGGLAGVGPQYTGESPQQQRDPFVDVNLAASLGNARWTATLFGNNVFDERHYLFGTSRLLFTASNPKAVAVALPAAPATYGIRVSIKLF